MAILGHVESQSIRGRIVHVAIIIALTLSGMSMVYPFIVMVSGSLRSEMDAADFDLIPDYLVDDAALYRKFLETKYNQNVEILNRTSLADHTSFRSPSPPEPAGASAPAERAGGARDDASPDSTIPGGAVDSLRAYLADDSLPLHWQNLGGVTGLMTVPERLRELRRRLMDRYDGNLDAIGRAIGSPVTSWHQITLAKPKWHQQRYDYVDSELYVAYFEMLRASDPAERIPVTLSGYFLQTIIYPRYGASRVDGFNAAHKRQIATFHDFRLPDRLPPEDEPTLGAEWLEFVFKELNPSFVVVEDATQAEYDAVQRELGGASRFTLTDGRRWLNGEERLVYAQFLEHVAPERLRLVGPEFEWSGGAIFDILPHLEYDYVLAHSGELRRRYMFRNYINVFDELLVQGNALINTVIYCTLAIVLALLVNPLAAYAMSRFKLRGTYRFLLILMATIAFPPMVTMIPQFILLRKLDLLNTFAALVIPLVANGYMIFLLKGFFDSLPQELYESARIDGAGEIRMFFQIAMALSKPILAVLALGTFASAYTAFLYPLLVAPDQDMWLISVWLFQFQQRASGPAIYASVLIASIPTLIIFLFAQRTIMRGIVVPTEK